MKNTQGSTLDFVLIGKIGKPHGVRGRLRLFPEFAGSDALEWTKVLFLVGPAAPRKRFELLEAQPADRFWIVTLEGVDGREKAEALTNFEVFVERSSLPALDAGVEYYVHDLIGLTVVTVAGEPLGTLVEVFNNGAHDILVYQPTPRDPQEPIAEAVMVPFVESFVGQVNFEAKTVEVRPFEIE